MKDIFDYDVCDNNGEKVGSVENIWMDANDEVEFVGIKTGFLGIGRSHLIPAEGVTIDDDAEVIRLPYDEELIKNSPTLESSDELSDLDESDALAYFGIPERDWEDQYAEPPSAEAAESTTEEIDVVEPNYESTRFRD